MYIYMALGPLAYTASGVVMTEALGSCISYFMLSYDQNLST